MGDWGVVAKRKQPPNPPPNPTMLQVAVGLGFYVGGGKNVATMRVSAPRRVIRMTEIDMRMTKTDMRMTKTDMRMTKRDIRMTDFLAITLFCFVLF